MSNRNPYDIISEQIRRMIAFVEYIKDSKGFNTFEEFYLNWIKERGE